MLEPIDRHKRWFVPARSNWRRCCQCHTSTTQQLYRKDLPHGVVYGSGCRSSRVRRELQLQKEVCLHVNIWRERWYYREGFAGHLNHQTGFAISWRQCCSSVLRSPSSSRRLGSRRDRVAGHGYGAGNAIPHLRHIVRIDGLPIPLGPVASTNLSVTVSAIVATEVDRSPKTSNNIHLRISHPSLLNILKVCTPVIVHADCHLAPKIK